MSTPESRISATEANIRITRRGKMTEAIAVVMPIWNRRSEKGNVLVNLPLLGIETVAKDETDAERAIEEAIISFCLVADKFGQGIEKELQALGWIPVDTENGEPLLGFSLSDSTEIELLLEQICHTTENYVNPHLEIA